MAIETHRTILKIYIIRSEVHISKQWLQWCTRRTRTDQRPVFRRRHNKYCGLCIVFVCLCKVVIPDVYNVTR